MTEKYELTTIKNDKGGDGNGSICGAKGAYVEER